MTWICDGVDGEGHVTGRETRRREKKRKTQIEVNGRWWIGLEEYEREKVENKRCGQNKMDICREGSQAQTYITVVLKKKTI